MQKLSWMVLTVIVSLSSLILPAWGQNSSSGRLFELSIAVDDAGVVRGEGLRIKYVLKNIADRDILINKHFMLGANAFVEFIDERGVKTTSGPTLYTQGTWLMMDDANMVNLAPEQGLEGDWEQRIYPLFDYLQDGFWEARVRIDVFTRTAAGQPELIEQVLSGPARIEVRPSR